MKLEIIDQNLVLSKVTEKDIIFMSPLKKPFSIHGVFYENGAYQR